MDISLPFSIEEILQQWEVSDAILAKQRELIEELQRLSQKRKSINQKRKNSDLMSTSFIAVQCCECETMQVNQRKKSNNKWTCVVCNQRQSLRKVFAEGRMARDIRGFVQSFNMSRKFADENQQPPPIESDFGLGYQQQQRGKRRTDWKEYLDPKDNTEQEEEDEFGPIIVTEMPEEMFKKPKLNTSSVGVSRANLYKPAFSKKNTTKITMSQGKEEARKHESSKVKCTSKWSEYMGKDDLEPEEQVKTYCHASKWDHYMCSQGERGESQAEGGRKSAIADELDYYQSRQDSMWADQKVEDDIHPDFVM